MKGTSQHGPLLAQALENVLGKAEDGAMAFVRCLTPEVVKVLAEDEAFHLRGWEVRRVSNSEDGGRTIPSDQAVEARERKGTATLLLVDTQSAGAGMDGIYSAAREVGEEDLFKEAHRLAAGEITRRLSGKHRKYAERAVRKARGPGNRFHLSPWAVFDFYCRVAEGRKQAGPFLHLLGLWPVAEHLAVEDLESLDLSRRFVDRLLDPATSGRTPAERIDALRLQNPSEKQKSDLEKFLHQAATKPARSALADLQDRKNLWIGALQVEGAAGEVTGVELDPWRTRTGKIPKWSGLVESSEGADEPPQLILSRDSEYTGSYAKLEARWKAHPKHLKKGAAGYRVAVVTAIGDEEITFWEGLHSAKTKEKCSFRDEDFTGFVEEDSVVSAKVVLSVIGSVKIQDESEEFVIRFGDPPQETVGGGTQYRTFSEALIDLSEDKVQEMTALATSRPQNVKGGFLSWRAPQSRKSFRVYRPPLIKQVENAWRLQGDVTGRWRIKVRQDGKRQGKPKFIPFPRPAAVSPEVWNRVDQASKSILQRYGDVGGVGQVYDENGDGLRAAKEYILAWTQLLRQGDPPLALAHTIEVQTQSGQPIGLIVLPSHPLRMAWHAAYDNLVLHAAFVEGAKPNHLRREFEVLDGTLFPAFLPGFEAGEAFVFADTLGFHAVGMVSDRDEEPKATVAILQRALEDGDRAKAGPEPTVGAKSAEVLGNEVVKYLESHRASRMLHVHAIRSGDGKTVARSLGTAIDGWEKNKDKETDDPEEDRLRRLAFMLELYPTSKQRGRGVAGRFITESQEKRRRRAGTLEEKDRWMVESLALPGGVRFPKLRWARKKEEKPCSAAHLALAFDIFDSRVRTGGPDPSPRPFHAFGLLSFLDRDFSSHPHPSWRSALPAWKRGEKHPADRFHTDRLMRLQNHLNVLIAQNMNPPGDIPVLQTEISRESAKDLEQLHDLCDWVVTLDRNAGIEYFDSPRDNREIYDAYVIDCVPEREDLGCLQLITSTTNFDEVRALTDEALRRMGLIHNRQNAEFLMEQLKALSGRLAIRLTGWDPRRTSELVALALSQANCCRNADRDDDCWVSLRDGFFVPIDDVRDLLPPLKDEGDSSRPDLLYVTKAGRTGLAFRFIEVKYRRNLGEARASQVLESVRRQTESVRQRWFDWYGHENIHSFRAIRRAKLARVLRFYADKAHRHRLSDARHSGLVREIDRMVEGGEGSPLTEIPNGDRGWVFCPEYEGARPEKISPSEAETQVFLFGPGLLPDPEPPHRVRDSSGSDAGGVGSIQVSPPSSDPSPAQNTRSDDHTGSTGSPPALLSGEDPVPAPSSPVPAPSPEGPIQPPKVIPSSEPLIVLGTDPFTGSDVRWHLTVKGNPHLLVAGLPGMGKTTCLLSLCQQMLAVDVQPIIFSYHQDLDQKLKRLVESIRFLDFDALGFNPLQILDRKSVKPYLDVSGRIRDIFSAIFPQLGDIQGEAIRTAVKESFIEAGWENGSNRETAREPEFKRFVEILRDRAKSDSRLRNLLARLEELNDYGFFDIGESHGSLWESRHPVVIRIHRTQSEILQSAFAAFILYGLYKDMFRRGPGDHITHAVIFDEAHRAAKLTLIPTMAKECRKYGVSLVLASQEAKDFNTSLFSAIANYLVLRLNHLDAKALVRNVATSRQEEDLVDKIKQMNKFKALYFCEGKTRPNQVNLKNLT